MDGIQHGTAWAWHNMDGRYCCVSGRWREGLAIAGQSMWPRLRGLAQVQKDVKGWLYISTSHTSTMYFIINAILRIDVSVAGSGRRAFTLKGMGRRLYRRECDCRCCTYLTCTTDFRISSDAVDDCW
jgi:hypothetical protein